MTSAEYPGDPSSVRLAREFVAHALRRVPQDVRDKAVLITSELATNAITHAHSGFVVTTRLDDGEVVVAVTDNGAETPLLRSPDRTEAHGRGLLIANALADRWGIDPQAVGKTVWFALALA